MTMNIKVGFLARGRGQWILVVLLLLAGVLSVKRGVFPGPAITNPEHIWLLIVRSAFVAFILIAAFLPSSTSDGEASGQGGADPHTILGIPLKWYAVALTLLLSWAWYARLTA